MIDVGEWDYLCPTPSSLHRGKQVGPLSIPCKGIQGMSPFDAREMQGDYVPTPVDNIVPTITTAHKLQWGHSCHKYNQEEGSPWGSHPIPRQSGWDSYLMCDELRSKSYSGSTRMIIGQS
jgi:hypothetical protein